MTRLMRVLVALTSYWVRSVRAVSRMTGDDETFRTFIRMEKGLDVLRWEAHWLRPGPQPGGRPSWVKTDEEKNPT